jgi:SAM-dependent methyltransferase
MLRELYKAIELPVFQNKMYPDQASALAAPMGSLLLVQDSETGLVFNSTFDQKFLSYDQDYQNEQAHSDFFQKHLSSVKSIIENFFSDKTIIEVGCGKGFFLDYLIEHGFNVKGIDPAYEGDSPNVIKACFDVSLGIKADNIVLRHVLEHIPDPFAFLKAIAKANGGKGKIYIEVPCLNWILTHKAWFDIFYEHVNYFRLQDFNAMFETVYESGHIFGDQYIYVVADLASLKTPKLAESDFIKFPNDFLNVEKVMSKLNPLGKNVVWGGASKGVIFSLNAKRFGFNIDYVVDINPSKQGKYIGGTGLLVSSPDSLIEKLTNDDNIFVMNSNYFDEIVKSSGNKFNYIKVD